MTISFDHRVENGILIITAKGKDDGFLEASNYAMSIYRLSKKHKCDMVFCDERNLEYDLSVIDTYSLAEGASKIARNLKKIAIVCQDKNLEDGKFYETVSKNRALSVFVSTDYNKAWEWINKNNDE